MDLKIQIGTTGKNKTYTRTEDFKRYSNVKKSLSSVLTEVCAAETYQQLNFKPKQKLSPAQRKMKAVQKRVVRKNINKDDYIRTTKISSPELSIRAEYQLAAQTFYRIVCRTPYDEDYEYTYSYTYKNYTPKNGLQYKNKTYKRMHTADDDRVKDHWQLRLKTTNGIVSFCMKDFDGIEFENALDDNWVKVMNIIGQSTSWMPFKDLEIFNLHPRLDLLEYGKYSRNYFHTEAHKGENRFHGTFGGYSVQAPRGFIRITEQEARDSFDAEVTKKKTITKRYKLPAGKYVETKKNYYESTGKHKWTLDFNMNISAMLKKAAIEVDLSKPFEEKDLLAAFLGRRNTVDANVGKVRKQQKIYIAYVNKLLKEGFNDIEQEVKISDEMERRLNILTHANVHTVNDKGVTIIGPHKQYKTVFKDAWVYDQYKNLDTGVFEDEFEGGHMRKERHKMYQEITPTSYKIQDFLHKVLEEDKWVIDERTKKINEIIKKSETKRDLIIGIVNLLDENGNENEYYAKLEKGKLYKSMSATKHIQDFNPNKTAWELVDIQIISKKYFDYIFSEDNFMEITL